MSNTIVQSIDGDLRVSSDVIAERTEVQHKNVLAYIRDNMADFEAFGHLAFETRDRMGAPGPRQQVAHLNEQQATLLMTFMRNSPVVKAFKIELVKQFYEMRQALTEVAVPQTLPEALRAYAEEVEQRMALTAKVAADEPKVTYVDTYVADEDLILFRNVAKMNGMTESALRDVLLDHQWIYAEEVSRWSDKKQAKEIIRRYSPYASHAQYFRTVARHEAPRFKGEVMHTLKITPQGASAITKAVRRWFGGPVE